MKSRLTEPLIYVPLFIILGILIGITISRDAVKEAQAQNACPPCEPCICPEVEPCLVFEAAEDYDEEDEEAILEALQALDAVEKFDPTP